MSQVIIKQNEDIFNTKCQAIICPTNSVGVMGAGLAKKFKDKKEYNEANAAYTKACMSGQIAPGSCWVYILNTDDCTVPCSYVIYLATKFHYSDESKLEWIENGLINLSKTLLFYDIKSVALPAIGCGLGGLPYPTVEMFVKEVFGNDSRKKTIELYAPH